MCQTENQTEELVYKVCKLAFLSPWTYPNPKGKDPNKELCDILIVCDNNVIVVSVKNIELKKTDDPEVDWKRWQRNAIDESIKQVKGAIRWLKQTDHVLMKNGYKLLLPSHESRNYQGLVIGFGSQRKIPIIDSDKNNSNFFHIMDEESFLMILQHANTITDFMHYLSEKNNFLQKVKILLYAGEENILAYYLANNRSFPEAAEIVNIDDNYWKDFSSTSEFIEKLKENEVSYIWDKLIESLYGGEFGKTAWKVEPEGDLEPAFQIIVKEDRLSRKQLGEAFKNFLNLSKEKKVVARIFSVNNKIGYVFFAYSKESSLEERKQELLGRSIAALPILSDYEVIIGIGVNIPGDIPDIGYSTEIVFLEKKGEEWSKDLLDVASIYREELGYFKSPVKITNF